MLKSTLVFSMTVAASTPSLLMAVPAPAPLTEPDEAKVICPVTGKVIPPGKGSTVVVRGQSYIVIDKTAADKLIANPDMFLNPDGTPKNADKADKKDPKPY